MAPKFKISMETKQSQPSVEIHQAWTLSNSFNCWLKGSRSGLIPTKSSKLKVCFAENEFFFSGTFVQVVGGRGKEVGMGGSKHFDPAKFRGLVLGVTDNFFFALIGSDAHLDARVFGFTLGFWGVLKPSEVGEGVHFRYWPPRGGEVVGLLWVFLPWFWRW